MPAASEKLVTDQLACGKKKKSWARNTSQKCQFNGDHEDGVQGIIFTPHNILCDVLTVHVVLQPFGDCIQPGKPALQS